MIPPVVRLLALSAGMSVAAYFGTRLLLEYAKQQAFKRDLDAIYRNAGVS
jgi:hypothetical protein